MASRRGSAFGLSVWNSSVPPSGAPMTLVRPIVCSWSAATRGPRPRSACGCGARRGRSRRAARRARRAGRRRPRRGGPARLVLQLDVAVPSLKPSRLRGVACACGSCEVRPKPSCDQRTVTSPRPMRARLRMAWKATCGSLAQAWTQRSPSVRLAVQRVAGKGGQLRELGRPVGLQAEAVVEQRGTEAERDVRWAGVRSERLAGVVGRRDLRARRRRLADRLAAGHRAPRPRVHSLSRSRSCWRWCRR